MIVTLRKRYQYFLACFLYLFFTITSLILMPITAHQSQMPKYIRNLYSGLSILVKGETNQEDCHTVSDLNKVNHPALSLLSGWHAVTTFAMSHHPVSQMQLSCMVGHNLRKQPTLFSWHHCWFPCETTCEEQAQKFHTHDMSSATQSRVVLLFGHATREIRFKPIRSQGCALAEPGGPWHPTFAPGQLENLRFFIQIICWAP